MARWIVAGLVALNLILCVGVYVRIERKAEAQIGRKVGNYATVAGESGVGGPVIYILDIDTGKLVVLKNDVTNGKVTPLTSTNVADDIKHSFH